MPIWLLNVCLKISRIAFCTIIFSFLTALNRGRLYWKIFQTKLTIVQALQSEPSDSFVEERLHKVQNVSFQKLSQSSASDENAVSIQECFGWH